MAAEGAGFTVTLTSDDKLFSESQEGSLSKDKVPQQGVSTEVKDS